MVEILAAGKIMICKGENNIDFYLASIVYILTNIQQTRGIKHPLQNIINNHSFLIVNLTSLRKNKKPLQELG
jgi:hypothetical protein